VSGINRKAYSAVAYLMGCALNGITPLSERLEGVEIGAICTIAQKHSVLALVTTALEALSIAPKRAVSEKNMAIRKVLLFDAKRAEVVEALEAAGITHMPLKGVYMKELYPSVGLRQMSDNDILFDPERRADVREIMEKLGFSTESYGKSNQDVYMMPPVFNFEMHVSLFPGTGFDKHKKYFDKAMEKGVAVEGTKHRLAMTDEDFYIYVKAHEYKHYSHNGTGLRSLADTYVFNKAKRSSLNLDYVNGELDKLGILEYEKRSLELANALFAPEALADATPLYDRLDEKSKSMFEYMCFAGTYGNETISITNAVREFETIKKGKRAGKYSYLWHRIFPPMSFYETYYPFYYKHKILIPFFFIKRICANLFLRPAGTFRRIKIILTSDKKSINTIPEGTTQREDGETK